MIKVTIIKAVRLIGVLLILLSGDAFAVTYATQPALNAEITNRKSGDSTETARAKVAEGALKAADTAEVSNRNKAIGTAIATETARAKAAEGALKSADTAEVTNRNTAIGTAIASEVTNRDTAIATETARAMAAEAAGSFSYSMTCGVSHTDACKIGAVGPGGGWIFFVDYNGQYPFNYLEAAPADIPAVAWCNNSSTSIPAVAGWSARAVGAGQANTDAMTQACGSGAANSAAAYSTPTTKAGDWFLGTLGDMMLMYTNLSYAGVGGFATLNGWWSSTESSSSTAWFQYFGYGYQSRHIKLKPLEVRAVRAF